MKSALTSTLCVLACVLAGTASYVSAESAAPVLRPTIKVVYPREGQQIPEVDSQFVVGQALGADTLLINGVPTTLFDSGAFLGWIPVQPGPFTIEVVASNAIGRSSLQRAIIVTPPARSTPQDSLRIEADRKQPEEDVWLWPGDLLEVYCQTSPRSEVFFSLPGVADRVPMTELPAQRRTRSHADGSIAPAVDSLTLSGVYYGAYRVGGAERADSVRVVFHARNRVPLYDHSSPVKPWASDSLRYSSDSLFVDLFSTDSSAGRVTILDDRFTHTAEVIDSVIVTRLGPGQGYFWPYTPRGTRLEVTGRRGDWVRMRAAPQQEIWAHDTSLAFLPPRFPVTQGTVNYTSVEGYADRTEVRLHLTRQLPYRISESLDPLELTVTVYGVTSNIDWIKYDFDDVLVAYADWRQPQVGVLEYTVHLNCDQLWGYDSYYDGSQLVVAIRKPPSGGFDLRGWHIVVDPGHSADDGSIGPTGLREKDANLWIARRLREVLERRGARVTLTREGSENVALYDRPKMAKREGADLFISVHNNAVRDGVNPWTHNGISTYYYHPSSKRLAEDVQAAMLSHLPWPDYGLYRGNFAVIRPTQYPAILVECAFMIIPEHEAALKLVPFQTRVAEAITAGIERFVEQSLPDRKYEDARRERRRRDRPGR